MAESELEGIFDRILSSGDDDSAAAADSSKAAAGASDADGQKAKTDAQASQAEEPDGEEPLWEDDEGFDDVEDEEDEGLAKKEIAFLLDRDRKGDPEEPGDQLSDSPGSSEKPGANDVEEIVIETSAKFAAVAESPPASGAGIAAIHTIQMSVDDLAAQSAAASAMSEPAASDQSAGSGEPALADDESPSVPVGEVGDTRPSPLEEAGAAAESGPATGASTEQQTTAEKEPVDEPDADAKPAAPESVGPADSDGVAFADDVDPDASMEELLAAEAPSPDVDPDDFEADSFLEEVSDEVEADQPSPVVAAPVEPDAAKPPAPAPAPQVEADPPSPVVAAPVEPDAAKPPAPAPAPQAESVPRASQAAAEVVEKPPLRPMDTLSMAVDAVAAEAEEEKHSRRSALPTNPELLSEQPGMPMPAPEVEDESEAPPSSGATMAALNTMQMSASDLAAESAIDSVVPQPETASEPQPETAAEPQPETAAEPQPRPDMATMQMSEEALEAEAAAEAQPASSTSVPAGFSSIQAKLPEGPSGMRAMDTMQMSDEALAAEQEADDVEFDFSADSAAEADPVDVGAMRAMATQQVSADQLAAEEEASVKEDARRSAPTSQLNQKDFQIQDTNTSHSPTAGSKDMQLAATDSGGPPEPGGGMTIMDLDAKGSWRDTAELQSVDESDASEVEAAEAAATDLEEPATPKDVVFDSDPMVSTPDYRVVEDSAAASETPAKDATSEASAKAAAKDRVDPPTVTDMSVPVVSDEDVSIHTDLVREKLRQTKGGRLPNEVRRVSHFQLRDQVPFSDAAVEEYRQLASNILALTAGRDRRAICFASCLREEGKSVSVLYTGQQLAQSMDRRVVVLTYARDVSECLKVEPECTLHDVFENRASLLETLITETGDERFAVLPMGSEEELASHLDSKGLLRDFLEALGLLFSVILVDALPILVMPSALDLLEVVGSAVLVAKSDSTQNDTLRVAVDRMREREVDVAGVVVTCA